MPQNKLRIKDLPKEDRPREKLILKGPQNLKDDLKFKELIEKSGHNLHLKVVQILKNKGWTVEISPYYYDEVIEKPREIDLVASKEIKFSISPHIDSFEYKIFLFIECKHLKKEVVFWMQNSNLEKATKAFKYSINIPELNNYLEAKVPPLEFPDAFRDYHYFNSPHVAKLFTTQQKEGGQDVIFQSFTNAIHSLIFFKEEKNEVGIYYPLVIYESKDKIAVVSPNETKNYRKLENNNKNLLLEVNYLYKQFKGNCSDNYRQRFALIEQPFLVDFVEKNDLDDFLDKIIEKEKEKINKILYFR